MRNPLLNIAFCLTFAAALKAQTPVLPNLSPKPNSELPGDYNCNTPAAPPLASHDTPAGPWAEMYDSINLQMRSQSVNRPSDGTRGSIPCIPQPGPRRATLTLAATTTHPTLRTKVEGRYALLLWASRAGKLALSGDVR